jgi:O-acetylhomoserine (thiol)-lyase
MGASLSPMNAFLFTQGLETLHLRMEKHCANASRIAKFLANHPKVNFVNYPELDTGNSNAWAKKYLGGKFGPMVGVDLKGGVKAGKALVENMKIFYHVANIGDVRSMAIHPASTTHSQVPSELRAKGGITDGYVRLCIGIEHIDDLLADMDQALKHC